MSSKLYVLKADVENPLADRRKKYDQWAQPVLHKGTRLSVTDIDLTGEGDARQVIHVLGSTSCSYGLRADDKRNAALVALLRDSWVEDRTLRGVLRAARNGPESLDAEEIIALLVATGRLKKSDVADVVAMAVRDSSLANLIGPTLES
jgi:hypothetical protein